MDDFVDPPGTIHDYILPLLEEALLENVDDETETFNLTLSFHQVVRSLKEDGDESSEGHSS